MQKTWESENSQEKKQTTEKYFLDTNALVYIISTEEIDKHNKIKKFIKNKDISISIQNLKELANVMFRRTNLGKSEIKEYLVKLAREFQLTIELPTDILNAIKISNRKNFYDSLLVTTMLRNGINKIVTENEKDFSEFKGIKVINPFK
jgi:predicted nucleic acid-binding protein